MSLTAVQLDVLARLVAVGGVATVGRGRTFKCNRVTARALGEKGFIVTNAAGDLPQFELAITSTGRVAVGGG